jgi:hypothetical protein
MCQEATSARLFEYLIGGSEQRLYTSAIAVLRSIAGSYFVNVYTRRLATGCM